MHGRDGKRVGGRERGGGGGARAGVMLLLSRSG